MKSTVFGVTVASVLLVGGCGMISDPSQSTVPEGAVRVAQIVTNAGDDVTVWNWCDRGTKVYLSIMAWKSTSVAASPNHKDCQ